MARKPKPKSRKQKQKDRQRKIDRLATKSSHRKNKPPWRTDKQ